MDFNIQMLIPVIKQALAEDIGEGDVTSNCTLPEKLELSGRLVAKQDGIIAGLQLFKETFRQIDPSVECGFYVEDGDAIKSKSLIGKVKGPGRALLSGERTALNFLQRMSGIATITRHLSDLVKGTPATILDTRKTVPGLRMADKWAVQIGGAKNHRIGLFDMVLIKDNHISAVGSISRAVQMVREKDALKRPIEVEVKDLEELQEALQLNVDRILLDNMSPAQMREAVILAKGTTPLEASGNINPENIRKVAESGVDFISMGMLTHSVKALDISFLIE